GMHFIIALPADAIPKTIPRDAPPRFFELQVKTLFQHAWAEAEHDIGYKPGRELNGDQERRFAFTAAQAWGADRIFAELAAELIALVDERSAEQNSAQTTPRGSI